MHKKKLLLNIRRDSGQRFHTQRKRRTEGKCYYKWRAYNKAFDRFLSHYQTRLLEAFAIPATEDDELARNLIIEAAISARRERSEEE